MTMNHTRYTRDGSITSDDEVGKGEKREIGDEGSSNPAKGRHPLRLTFNGLRVRSCIATTKSHLRDDKDDKSKLA